MSISTRIKMYPELEKDGSFEVEQSISDRIRAIYHAIDMIKEPDEAEDILDEYNQGILKAIETILNTPIGQLYEKIEELLEEIQTAMQVNYDAYISDKDDSNSEEDCCTLEEKDPVVSVIERKPNDDDDISDEEMLRTLEG